MPFKRFAKPLSQIFGGATPELPAQAEPMAAPESMSPATIIARALGDGDEALRAPAIRELARLVDADSVDFAALCAPGANVQALLAVAGQARDPAHLGRALALIEEPGRMAALALEGASSRIRQLAAQGISDPEELRRLLKQARGKDKNVYKIVKQRCDALRAVEQREAQLQHEAIAACESLERHGHRIHDAIYEPTFRHFHERWQALEPHAAAPIRERAARAIERCRTIMAEHLRELERRAAAESERAAMQAAREQAAALAQAEALRRSEAESLAAAEAEAARAAEEKLRADQAAAESLALRQIGGLIGKAHGALREGNTGRASGLRRAIDEKLAAMPMLHAALAKQLAQLDGQLNELKGWKEHAAAPKRALLIADMEALIGSSEEPAALAERIRQLQADWKTVSKGVVIDSEADWQRFQRAALAAYQPCREHFEAQAKLREANVERRRAVLDRLLAFESAEGSAEHPDYRRLATVLREAPQEWRRHFPVERAAGRALQKEFDAALGRLQGRLDAWQAKNAADKEALIEQARALATGDGGREAAEAIKRLQLRWKETGPARRDPEQALWTAFRAACDAVFAKREQAHAEHAAALEANKARAAALCEEIEQAAGLTGAPLLDSAARTGAWRSAFAAIGELPRAERRSLEDRLERALERVRAAVADERRREKELSFADLFDAARRIQAYAWAVSRGAPGEECAALKQAAEGFIAGVQKWPKGGAEAVRDALAGAGAGAAGDPAAHERALRMLCIRGEILAERETPAEDQPLRRGYQMERLVQRMGQGGAAPADAPDALALEWVRVGAVPPETHEALLERFLRARGA